ncbi:MAG: hypothetical protein Q9225_007800 [Loekoesia sp. 1 TL-2023]
MTSATNAMALLPPVRLLPVLIFASYFFFTAIAQDIAATNDDPGSGPEFDLALVTPMSKKSYKVDPLTDHSKSIVLSGVLVATDTRNVNSLLGSTIAYISCDDSSYPGNIGAEGTFNLAIHHTPPPVAVILYSVDFARCSFTPNNYLSPSIYSMQDANSSSEVLGILRANTTMAQNTTVSPHGSDGNGGGGILGKSPTTAVAMIILYSITGIITALFLIIIVVGAIRAHRHPERYGPRNIVGRPRQSRAKGIARAMLETIPIVKFGDHDDPKPANQQTDVEMAPQQTIPETSTQGQAQQETSGPANQRRTTEASNEAATTEEITDREAHPQPTEDPIANADNGLACSVCTDDFAKGQDVRVLPCNHKFHPECIDPWLLNVSGTCPLCRVDLRPTTSNDEFLETQNNESSTRRHSEALTSFAATPQLNQSRRSSRSRPLHYLHHYLNRGRMEDATPQERLEALRRLRLINRSDVDQAAQQEGGESSAAGERSSNRNRLSARLSRAFGGDRSRPVSWAPGTPTPAVQETRNEEPEANRNGDGVTRQ